VSYRRFCTLISMQDPSTRMHFPVIFWLVMNSSAVQRNYAADNFFRDFVSSLCFISRAFVNMISENGNETISRVASESV
jgi:hypothetical protein